MIYWLTQSSESHPDLGFSASSTEVLSAEERQKFGVLKTDKRRHDWLLGRWTAKRLLQAVIHARHGVTLPLNRVNILPDADGAPLVSINEYAPFTLSISHSKGTAFCGVIECEAWPLGVDIERIEPHSEVFVADYFTTAEVDRINSSPPRTHDVLVTAIWCAKEAVLKALRVGLRVDTWAVTCLIEPPAKLPLAWQPFGIALDGARLKSAVPALTGWWRVQNGYVLTLASRCSA